MSAEPAASSASSSPSSSSDLAAGSRRRAAWAALVVLAVLWLGTLGHRALIHPDEGRYATLALGMAQSGDWVTPRLNGLVYFEKPPLQYWIGAASFELFGVHAWSARLWPGLAGLLTVLMLGATAARLWGRDAGWRTVCVAAAMTWIAINSHFLSLDAGLTFFLSAALCAWLIAEASRAEPKLQRRWVLIAWIAIAGAVLSKGLVGLLIPGCVVLMNAAWERDFGVWRRLHLLPGLAVLLLLTAPWFVLVSRRNPEFAEFFFIHEHFARYLTKAHQREGAWWYFVPLLLLGSLPWTGALPFLARAGAKATNDRSVRRLLLLWAGFVFVFFSLSSSKLPSYILPMFPALALLIAQAMDGVEARTLRRHGLLGIAVWLALFALTLVPPARFASAATPAEAIAPLAYAVRVAALIFLLCAAAAYLSLRSGREVNRALAFYAAGHLIGLFTVMQAHDGFGQLKSAQPIAQALQPMLAPDTEVFAVRSYDQTLPFYLGRPVTLVDYVDEFALGQQREPQRSLPTLEAFAARWQAAPQAAAYMARTTWDELKAGPLPMRVVFEDARRVVVVKP